MLKVNSCPFSPYVITIIQGTIFKIMVSWGPITPYKWLNEKPGVGLVVMVVGLGFQGPEFEPRWLLN